MVLRLDNAELLPARYVTSLDRAGLALGTGGLLNGVLVTLLVALGGETTASSLLIAFALGTVMSAVGLAAVGGPVWLVMHVAGWRRGRHALIAGALSGLILFVGAQTQGFGLAGTSTLSGAASGLRWLSAIATGLVFACIAGAIAWVMWRVAYRREDQAG